MATKTFPNAVIWHGKLIPANTPIEIKENKETTETVVKKNDKRAGAKS